ncbi:membrane metallo-endopeptidase-like 1 isoform X3 [Mobula hypostoma]|uniref:membrane metallo-endopeptidase-like 1 isoform X3 n=1 Tax=Mobula hypostoma TaxID=723540 RepID=UPI002FC29AE6
MEDQTKFQIVTIMGKSESQMDIVEKSTKLMKKSWTIIEIALSALLLLMTSTVVVLAVLYTTQRGKQFSGSTDKVCMTAGCVAAAARLIQNMDASASPCEDFYKYACGGWLNRHIIPETSSGYSIFDIVTFDLEVVLKGVLERPDDRDRDAYQKAKQLYKSCVNDSLIARRDSEPLLNLLDAVGGWPVATPDWDATKEPGWSLESMLPQLTANYSRRVIVDIFVCTDDRNSSRYIICIDQPGLGMPSRDYYFRDGNFRRVREAYLQFMISIAKLIREDKNITKNDSFVEEEMMTVLELECEMANATATPEERHDITQLYNKMTLAELQVKFDLHALYGTTVEDARWRECARYTNFNMRNAVGALYVREAFNGDSKKMVKDLIDKIREVFIETLDELEWMDPASKQKAQEKVMAIKEQIGYPDYILEEDNPRLDREYAHLNFSETKYFENNLEILKAGAQKVLRKLREQMDQNIWMIGAAIVNAFYSPNRNLIVFPAAILQPPFFSKHQHQALNFGGIGMVIAHEIIHGFDDNGRNFDKDGNLYDWWSNFSATHFKDRSRCIVNQYGNYTWDLAGGQNVSGINTLSENIADNGGIRQAYKAYMKWVKRRGEVKLPGLNLTHKQLFFLNFAQVWCGSYRPEYASQVIKTEVHTPLKFRVIGSLQNFEAFAEAFQCSRGNAMHPAKKCRVW